MRRSRIITAGLALAAVAAVGGVTAAAGTGSPASSAPRAGIASAAPAAGPAAAAATVRTARAAVAGTTETILVNGHGQPLYYYRPETATRSLVTAGLARMWPPLTSAALTAAGVNGRLTVVKDAHGGQVAYNGHLLYTFASDSAGRVTGQGFQNFFVATPGLAPLTSAAAPATTIPAAPYGGYGY
jgi:predicted lipoprotein with Yx(FWY)xxD motif